MAAAMLTDWFGIPLWARILAGLALGALVGALFPAAGPFVKPLGDVFLNAIRMLIVPLVVSTLITGVVSRGLRPHPNAPRSAAPFWVARPDPIASLAMLPTHVPGPGGRVEAVLDCIGNAGRLSTTALPRNTAEMAAWPALSEDAVHDAASDYFRHRGVRLE